MVDTLVMHDEGTADKFYPMFSPLLSMTLHLVRNLQVEDSRQSIFPCYCFSGLIRPNDLPSFTLIYIKDVPYTGEEDL